MPKLDPVRLDVGPLPDCPTCGLPSLVCELRLTVQPNAVVSGSQMKVVVHPHPWLICTMDDCDYEEQGRIDAG